MYVLQWDRWIFTLTCAKQICIFQRFCKSKRDHSIEQKDTVLPYLQGPSMSLVTSNAWLVIQKENNYHLYRAASDYTAGCRIRWCSKVGGTVRITKCEHEASGEAVILIILFVCNGLVCDIVDSDMFHALFGVLEIFL